jgi:stress-induced-phosphoprotein 1
LEISIEIMDKEKAKEISAKAKEAFSKQDYAAAIKYYTEAIAADPTDHIFFSNRSACYANLKQYEDAFDDAKKCVELKPDFARGYGRKGLAEFYLNRFEDAKKTYEEGLKLDPNNTQLKEGLERAEECLSGPQGSGGMPSQQEILKKLLNDPVTREYLKDKDFVSKLQMCMANPKLLMSLIGTDPRMGKVLEVLTGLSMADLASAAGVPGGMPPEPHFHEPPKAPEPETPEQIANREAEEAKAKGNQEYKNKNFEEALKYYDKAASINEKEPIYILNKASVYLSMRKFKECLAACDEAIKLANELTPKPFDKIAKAFARKGNCYTQMNQWDEA